MSIVGVVTLDDGVFANPTEILHDHLQVPQFLPRTAWPTADAAREMQSAKLDPFNLPLDAASSKALFEKVLTMYRHLAPMPPFINNGLSYSGIPWFLHVAILHRLFNGTFGTHRGLSVMEVQCLLAIVSYGTHESVAFIKPYRVKGLPDASMPRTKPNTFEEVWNPTYDMPTKLGGFHDGNEIRGSEECKRLVWGRRFIVVPIIYGVNDQWGMTVFDRFSGDLYIFDCADDELKTQRIDSCIHFWIEFWNALGMAKTFRYFVGRVNRQPSVEDSSLLCVIWLMDLLRNQVGRRISSLDEGAIRQDKDVCEPDVRRPLQSSLHLRDWVPLGCQAGRTSLMGVRRIIRILICNELGWRHHDIMNRRYATWQGATMPSPWDLLSPVVEQLGRHGNQVDASIFWTGLGGPQFALAMKTAVPPYSSDQNRRHYHIPGHERHLIETDHRTLSSTRPWTPPWTQNIVYTPSRPITRPLPAVHLRVSNLVPLTETNTARTRNFTVRLTNTLAREGYEDLNQPLVITFDRIQFRQDRRDGFHLRFALSVSVAGGEPVETEVIIPVGEVPPI
ncbi:hypothetical protein UVI_02051880 [Ustilaginoidea virens]|uniref:Uncharacterized protein n=1 Tax=Ustilaginoidea virens TaxID=1159556 RepID=A0A1B5L8S8_USTVR|nr:hypothetical protein UVI_02051880 [Ustilaginoidea virens]